VDINLESAEWCTKLAKENKDRKGRIDFDQYLTIPLSNQVIEILQTLHRFTGDGVYVFPGQRTKDRPMSENAVLAALRRMGIPKEEMCGHGFRAAARTILREQLHIEPEYIEHEMGHQVIDPQWARVQPCRSFAGEASLNAGMGELSRQVEVGQGNQPSQTSPADRHQNDPGGRLPQLTSVICCPKPGLL
jgi:hypothetical protein